MNVYEIGPFKLNADRLTLTSAGRNCGLGPKVVETLLALAEHAGEALSKDALLDRVWPEGFVEESNLTQNIYVLRKTFRSHGEPDPIETLPRYGYRLTAPVRALETMPERRSPRRLAAAFAAAAVVAACLILASTSVLRPHVAKPPLSDNGARLYQIGRYYWDLRTRDGVQKSLRYFAQVVDSDPKDPRGYAALADANITMGDYCYGTHRPAVYFARAAQYAREALALDPNSADAHAALGFLALARGDKEIGSLELERAIALDSSYAPAHEWYGIALLGSGNSAAALQQLKLAADLDPLSVAATAWLGSAAYKAGRFEDAIAYERQVLELAPARADALITMARAYGSLGKFAEAAIAFEQAREADPYHVRVPNHRTALESAARLPRTI